ncbi:acetylornithine deacetylase/succinyl-diaminopimelate desuccinylase-like protein [Streptomyces sp. 1114.5]|uniref:dipeptidase n=1 Tax=unclassified Streptomyces TaxID=2593676 RepID=UPI000BCFA25A|nr:MULTISPECIES: dipeptidase [unclassified Streptomyces]RKT11909.1 acetylornithine deacetylase/succinyl-diaminopimelate desuccinylase-like protein [Streptomyces sp. 1114.5]SOB80265.1 Acetylornithine deacetylase/Succinyl-diaminopimelate desuccinylase [Streptomyces sp. 1331.2]
MSQPLADAVRSLMDRARTDLAELVAFPSVADPRQFPVEECEKAARWVADAFAAEGLTNIQLLDTPDGTQSVYAELPGPEGAPTVLLYSHYDVQPPLDEDAWISPAFELTERDGRWYGRGAADCKGNILMHLTALRALRQVYGDAYPVGLKIIVEGSEEQGTGGLERYAEAHPELLTADAIIIGDTGNFAAGLPTVTASLRGMTVVEATVTTLAGNLHSGAFGGAAPDALQSLVRILASLHDSNGDVAVAGLAADQTWDGVQYPEEQFRADAKVLDGVALTGTGTIADRLWARPSVTVLGIDAPPVIGATSSVQAAAKALISLRVPPGTDASAAQDALVAHLEKQVPLGARLTVERRGSGSPFRADTTGPAYEAMGEAMAEAFGTDMVASGEGGSIPLCNTLRSLYPQAEIVLIGVEEPATQIHAVNESVDPQELERMALAEALFLRRYAELRSV